MKGRPRAILPTVISIVIALALLAPSAVSAASGPAKRLPTLTKQELLNGTPGGLDNHGDVWGRVSNLTPYTWTLVTAKSCDECANLGDVEPPQKVEPGQDYVYAAALASGDRANFLNTEWNFNTTIVYRAQTVSGPEDLTIRITGCHCTGLVFPNSEISVQIYNSDPHGEIGWTQSDPVFSDVQFQVQGHFSIDAAKNPPQLVDVINALCAGATGTSCAFAATGPLTWGVGDPAYTRQAANCTIQPAAATAVDPPPPPGPGWFRFSIKVTSKGSISVGGSLTGSTEVNLFGIIDAEVSARFGAEHEWSNSKSLEKTTQIYLPSNYIGSLRVVPVQGKVIGTLVVSNAVATYTITNFGEVQDGVSRDRLTPAFDVITTSHSMTPAELKDECHSATSAKRGAGSIRGRVAARR
jgi:hypothetical protein